MAALWASSAKNRRVDKTGYSARTWVFCKAERFPGSVVDNFLNGTAMPELEASLQDTTMQLSNKIRAASMIVLEMLGNSERWQRAIIAGVTPMAKSWTLGAQVHLWRTTGSGAMIGDGKRRFRRWRVQELYFVAKTTAAHRTRTLHAVVAIV